MFNSLQTFKDLFTRTVTNDLYNVLKKVEDIKLETKELTSELSKGNLIEESFLVFEEDVVVIVCDLTTELELKEKYIRELELTCLILNCSSLEFRNTINKSNSEYTDKLKKMFENS